MFIDQPDALSSIIRGLELEASLDINGDFCGDWAIDSSGNRQVPFHYVNRGVAFYFGASDQPTQLEEGDIILFPRDASHVITNMSIRPSPEQVNLPLEQTTEGPKTNLLCGFFEFKSKLAWPLLDKLDDVILLRLPSKPLQLTIQSMIEEIKLKEPGWKVIVNELAYILFIFVLRKQCETSINGSLLSALFHPKIGQALSLIHERAGKNWSIEKLALQLGMSRSSFAEQFKDKVGMSVMNYITEWRMREATQLLLNSDNSISQIAEQCGYQSEVSFRKAYKKTKGETPGQVRRSRETLMG